MHRAECIEAKQGKQKNDNHLADIGTQQELDRLADIVVDLPSLFHGPHNCRVIIICQNQIRRVFRYIRSCNPHADTDISGFYRRRVVHAVTGHSRNGTPFPPRVYNPDLMLRLHSGVNMVFVNISVQLLIADAIQLRPGFHLGIILDNAKLSGYSCRRIPVVAGNHDRTDSGLPAFSQRVRNLLPHRIHHAGQPDKAQIPLCLLRGMIFRERLIGSSRGRKNTQRVGSHGTYLILDDPPSLFIQRQFLSILDPGGAATQDNVRSPFGILYNPLFRAVERRHHLAGGIKRTLCDTGHGLFRLLLVKSLFLRKGHERRFRRLSLNRPVLIRLRIAAQGHGFRQELPVSKGSDNRHPVLRQRSRLIRTDHIGAAQSLHRCQPAHNGICLRHTGDTQRQNQRNNGRQPFRNRRDSKRDRDHEHLQNCAQVSFRSHHHIENKDENADENDHHRQLFAKLVQLLLQRRLTVLRLVQNTGDLSHFRPHACVRYQKPASPIGDAASHESHIFAVTQGYLSVLFLPQHFHKLLYGYRLSGQRGLVYTQRLRLQKPSVSRNHISCFQKHNISRYQTAAGDLLLFSVTDDMAGRRRHFLQRLHRVFRLALLKNSQRGVQPHHDQNDKYFRHGFS